MNDNPRWHKNEEIRVSGLYLMRDINDDEDGGMLVQIWECSGLFRAEEKGSGLCPTPIRDYDATIEWFGPIPSSDRAEKQQSEKAKPPESETQYAVYFNNKPAVSISRPQRGYKFNTLDEARTYARHHIGPTFLLGKDHKFLELKVNVPYTYGAYHDMIEIRTLDKKSGERVSQSEESETQSKDSEEYYVILMNGRILPDGALGVKNHFPMHRDAHIQACQYLGATDMALPVNVPVRFNPKAPDTIEIRLLDGKIESQSEKSQSTCPTLGYYEVYRNGKLTAHGNTWKFSSYVKAYALAEKYTGNSKLKIPINTLVNYPSQNKLRVEMNQIEIRYNLHG